MKNIFASADFGVERDRGLVRRIGLNVDDIGAPSRSNHSEVVDERGRDAVATMLRLDGQVVNVNLAPLLFELKKFVGHESAND